MVIVTHTHTSPQGGITEHDSGPFERYEALQFICAMAGGVAFRGARLAPAATPDSGSVEGIAPAQPGADA